MGWKKRKKPALASCAHKTVYYNVYQRSQRWQFKYFQYAKVHISRIEVPKYITSHIIDKAGRRRHTG